MVFLLKIRIFAITAQDYWSVYYLATGRKYAKTGYDERPNETLKIMVEWINSIHLTQVLQKSVRYRDKNDDHSSVTNPQQALVTIALLIVRDWSLKNGHHSYCLDQSILRYCY